MARLNMKPPARPKHVRTAVKSETTARHIPEAHKNSTTAEQRRPLVRPIIEAVRSRVRMPEVEIHPITGVMNRIRAFGEKIPRVKVPHWKLGAAAVAAAGIAVLGLSAAGGSEAQADGPVDIDTCTDDWPSVWGSPILVSANTPEQREQFINEFSEALDYVGQYRDATPLSGADPENVICEITDDQGVITTRLTSRLATTVWQLQGTPDQEGVDFNPQPLPGEAYFAPREVNESYSPPVYDLAA